MKILYIGLCIIAVLNTSAIAQTTVKVVSLGPSDRTVKIIDIGPADITVKFIRDGFADIRVDYTEDRSKANVIITKYGVAESTVKAIDIGPADVTVKITSLAGAQGVTIGVPKTGKVNFMIYTEDGFFERREVIWIF